MSNALQLLIQLNQLITVIQQGAKLLQGPLMTGVDISMEELDEQLKKAQDSVQNLRDLIAQHR